MDRTLESGRSILALVIREIESGPTSPLSTYIWALTETILGVFLLSAIFMLAFPAPPLGESLALFYASGLVPLMAFQDITQKATIAFRFSKPLIGFARLGLLEIILARVLFASIIQTFVAVVVLAGLLFWTGTRVQLDVFHALMAWGLVLWLALGMGFFGAFLSCLVPIWPQVWATILKPLVLISGVFFLVDEVASPFREVLIWNPIAQLLLIFRRAFFDSYHADITMPGFTIAVGSAGLLIGLMGIRIMERSIVDEFV